MKRLKMRSTNSSHGEFKYYSGEMQKKDQPHQFSSQNRLKTTEEYKSKKHRKLKDFPLPISSTTNKLKKAINARL